MNTYKPGAFQDISTVRTYDEKRDSVTRTDKATNGTHTSSTTAWAHTQGDPIHDSKHSRSASKGQSTHG